MFWHEAKENEINLISYNKSDYLKMINPKNSKLKDKDSKDSIDEDSKKGLEKNILDLSQPFKVDMWVSSDWGPGKVVSVNKATKKVVLKIEGVDQEFDMFGLHPFLQVYMHVYFKQKELNDKKILLSFNLSLDDTFGKIKKRIANIFKTNPSQVIITHGGEKLSNNNQKVSDCGIYIQDSLLVVINGTCDY